jgi:hypothetical protein
MDATSGRVAIAKHLDIGAGQHQLKFNHVIEKLANFSVDDCLVMRTCANATSQPSDSFPTLVELGAEDFKFNKETTNVSFGASIFGQLFCLA